MFQREHSSIWDMRALCAVAWLNVAEAYPFNGIFWLWHRNRPSANPHQHKITVNYFISRLLYVGIYETDVNKILLHTFYYIGIYGMDVHFNLLKLIYKCFYIMIMEQGSRNNHITKYNNQERMCYYVTSNSTNKILQ